MGRSVTQELERNARVRERVTSDPDRPHSSAIEQSFERVPPTDDRIRPQDYRAHPFCDSAEASCSFWRQPEFARRPPSESP
jgi:hypothetical protein